MVYDEKSFLGLTRLLRAGLSKDDLHIEDHAVAYLREPVLLSFAKAAHPSRVHRPAYPDYVSIRELDGKGRVIREVPLHGPVHLLGVQRERQRHPLHPRQGRRSDAALRFRHQGPPRQGTGPGAGSTAARRPVPDPGGRAVQHRLAIVRIQERNKIRVFLRKDPYGRFCYCLAYVPRDVYSTETRLKIQQVLMERLQASDCEFWTFFSESVLARVQFILRVDPKSRIDIDPARLEEEVIQACRSWQDDYSSLVVENLGEAKGTNVLADFPKGFPAGYRERFAPHFAVVDLQHLLSLSEQRPLVMSFTSRWRRASSNCTASCTTPTPRWPCPTSCRSGEPRPARARRIPLPPAPPERP